MIYINTCRSINIHHIRINLLKVYIHLFSIYCFILKNFKMKIAVLCFVLIAVFHLTASTPVLNLDAQWQKYKVSRKSLFSILYIIFWGIPSWIFEEMAFLRVQRFGIFWTYENSRDIIENINKSGVYKMTYIALSKRMIWGQQNLQPQMKIYSWWKIL